MQGLKAIEQDSDIGGYTQTLRNLVVGQAAVYQKQDINRRSLEAIKSKLKRKEGIILKSKTINGVTRVKRLF